jgi:hypothetical protein
VKIALTAYRIFGDHERLFLYFIFAFYVPDLTLVTVSSAVVISVRRKRLKLLLEKQEIYFNSSEVSAVMMNSLETPFLASREGTGDDSDTEKRPSDDEENNVVYWD